MPTISMKGERAIRDLVWGKAPPELLPASAVLVRADIALEELRAIQSAPELDAKIGIQYFPSRMIIEPGFALSFADLWPVYCGELKTLVDQPLTGSA
jgi:hypothetical protein